MPRPCPADPARVRREGQTGASTHGAGVLHRDPRQPQGRRAQLLGPVAPPTSSRRGVPAAQLAPPTRRTGGGGPSRTPGSQLKSFSRAAPDRTQTRDPQTSIKTTRWSQRDLPPGGPIPAVERAESGPCPPRPAPPRPDRLGSGAWRAPSCRRREAAFALIRPVRRPIDCGGVTDLACCSLGPACSTREETAHVHCGHRLLEGQCLSMADYVTGTGPTRGAGGAGGCQCCLRSWRAGRAVRSGPRSVRAHEPRRATGLPARPSKAAARITAPGNEGTGSVAQLSQARSAEGPLKSQSRFPLGCQFRANWETPRLQPW